MLIIQMQFQIYFYNYEPIFMKFSEDILLTLWWYSFNKW